MSHFLFFKKDIMFSRRKTRMLLVQLLYSDIFIKKQDITIFREAYDDKLGFSNLDDKYLDLIRSLVHRENNLLLGIISALAPKFDIGDLPKIHVIILCIALTEILFWKDDTIDKQISINEAIELGKIFSDIQGAKFINGVLGEFVRKKEYYKTSTPVFFKFFY